MSQPPYGVPPQQPPPYPGQQGQPGQPAAPPAYLGGGAPGPGVPPPYGAPHAGLGGPGLPPPPASRRRTIGLVMGLVTTFALIAFVLLVWLITANG